MYVRECGQDLSLFAIWNERGLYTLWVELSVMLAYASLTDVDSHTGDCSQLI